MSGVLVGKVRVLLLEDDSNQSDRLRQLLRDEDMELNVVSGSVEDGLRNARTWSPDVILVAKPGRSLTEAVKKVDLAYGHIPVVALLTAEQSAQARDVLLAGASAFLPEDAGRDDLVDTLLSMLEHEKRRRTALAKRLGVEVGKGQVVAVHGSKGGVGATAVAVNLAVAIRLAGRASVALVDANLYSGDVAACLHLMSRSNLADLTPHLKELDREFLDRASVKHASGVHAFLAPDDFAHAQIVTGEQIKRMLKVMRDHYDYVIVDTCSLPDPVTASALDESDRILLVLTPEVPALKNAARFLQLSGEFGHQAKTTLVLNRANSRGALTVSDIKTHLKASVSVKIATDGSAVVKSVNEGQPLVSGGRNRFAGGIWQLTALVTGAPVKQLRRAGKRQPEADAEETIVARAPEESISNSPRQKRFARLRPGSSQ